MRRLSILFLALLLMIGIACGRGYGVKKMASVYETQARLDRYPPILGDNNIEIEIKDSAGKSVTDAKVLGGVLHWFPEKSPHWIEFSYFDRIPFSC